MTIAHTIIAVIAAVALIALLLPRKVVVTRQTDVAMRPEDVIARVASTEGFQTFNPYCTADPDLKITPFGPAEGVGSGFRFEGKEGKGTQNVTDVTATSVTHLGPPPLKWSSAMFRKMEEDHGQQAPEARRDCYEVTAG